MPEVVKLRIKELESFISNLFDDSDNDTIHDSKQKYYDIVSKQINELKQKYKTQFL